MKPSIGENRRINPVGKSLVFNHQNQLQKGLDNHRQISLTNITSNNALVSPPSQAPKGAGMFVANRAGGGSSQILPNMVEV
jgi:hypothetical protein